MKSEEVIEKFFRKEYKEIFFIKILKSVELNLKEKKEKIYVLSNFPFCDYYYRYDDKIPSVFLKDLKEWVKTPLFKYNVTYNRKQENKVSSYNLPSFRTKQIDFENVKFIIGKEAEQDFDLEKFKSDVKDILSQQKIPTDKEVKEFNRYLILLERVENLKRRIPKERYSYYYGGRKKEDKSLKFYLDKKEYNKRLKVLEDEFKILCNRNKYLEMPSLDYKKINKILSFEKWKDDNLDEAEEIWAEYDDDDKEEFDGDFDKFLKDKYDEYVDNFEE